MRQTVRMAIHACLNVCATHWKKSPTLSLTTSAVMIAASRIAVPVARGWKAHTAA